MKTKSIKIAFLSLLLLGAGWMSCTRTSFEDPGPVPPAGEEGYLTLSMKVPGEEAGKTRSTTTMEEVWGREEENFIKKVRMVLYDVSSSPRVQYAFDFNIMSKLDQNGYASQLVQYYYDSGNQLVTRGPGEDAWYGKPADYTRGKPHLYEFSTTPHLLEDGTSVERADHFITWARRVKRAPYQMLLIVNPVSTEESTDPDVTRANDLYEVTAPGKPLSALWEEVRIKKENLLNSANGGFAGDNYFLMTNHDDLVQVSEEELMPTEQLANDNPVPVTVSRAVSKITVQKSETFVVTPDGASAANFRWEPEVTNRRSYWMRKMTYLMSTGGGKGGMETQNSDRKHIYAEDPNFGAVTDKATHFNYLSDGGSNIPDLGYYLVSEAPSGDQNREYAYVLENTQDEDQLPASTDITQSDVITTAMVSCQYAPKGMTIGSSYFLYGGYVIPLQTMGLYVSDRSKIPNRPVYVNLSADIDQAISDGLNLTNPTESFSSDNFKYYHQGKNYYPVMIEHGGGSDMQYGYYGVLRNFFYEITIDKIKGPGQPTTDIETSGDGNIEVEIRINKWQERNQNNKPGEKIPRLVVYYYLHDDTSPLNWEDPSLTLSFANTQAPKAVTTVQGVYLNYFTQPPADYEYDQMYRMEWRTDITDPDKTYFQVTEWLYPYSDLEYTKDEYIVVFFYKP